MNLSRGAIAGEDDLLAPAVNLVEGVQKFLLRRFFVGEEMDVVDHEQFGGADAAAERLVRFCGARASRNSLVNCSPVR